MSIGLLILTIVHTLISLIAIVGGSAVLYGLLNNQRYDNWTWWFLVFTVATSVTGFFFPVHKLLPSHVLAILSLIVLPIAIYARYSRQMAGRWRLVYITTAMIAFYFNMFVLVVQSFLRIPPLKAIAPTQSEPPFAVAQLVVLLAFIVLTILAVRRFHPSTRESSFAQPAM